MSFTSLFDRLGGPNVVGLVMEDFHRRVSQDQTLGAFFVGHRHSFLKIHQLNILKYAVRDDVTDEQMFFVFKRHEKLFRNKGLTASHFDRMMLHLVASLRKNSVDSTLVDEAIVTLGKVRSIFQEGAEYKPTYVPPKQLEERTRSLLLSGNKWSSQKMLRQNQLQFRESGPIQSPTSTSSSGLSVSEHCVRFTGDMRSSMVRSPSFMRRSMRIFTTKAA